MDIWVRQFFTIWGYSMRCGILRSISGLYPLDASSVQFSCSVVSDSLRPHESQHTRPPCPSSTPRVHPNSCPLSQWCHPAISSSIVPFSSCPQSLPVSESFPISHLFAWGSQSIGVSSLASVLPENTQDWSPLEWTGWISLQSKGLSRVFSNTTVQKHQFFSAQLSSQPTSPNCDNQRHLQTVPDVSRGGAGCAELRAKSSGVWIHKRVSLGDSYWATSTSGPPGTIILHRAWNSKSGKEILLHIFESRPPVW